MLRNDGTAAAVPRSFQAGIFRQTAEAIEPAEVAETAGAEVAAESESAAEQKAAAQTAEAPENPAEFMRTMAGSPDPAVLERILAAMSPIHHIEDGKKYPPFLLLHGDSDEVVSCVQLTYMAERLSQAGADVTTAIVEGAPHEGPFWSQPVYDLIESFIREHI